MNAMKTPILPPRPVQEAIAVPELLSSRFSINRRYQVFRARGTATWQMFFTLGGCGYFRSADGKTVLYARPGDVQLYEPGAMHDYGTAPGPKAHWDHHWVHFHAKPEWKALLDWKKTVGIAGLRNGAIKDAGVRREMDAIYTKLHAGLTTGLFWKHELALNAVERMLMLAKEAEASKMGPTLDPRISAVLETIHNRPEGVLRVPEMARQATLSLSRFSHLFKKETGYSPQTAVLRARLEKARQMLELTPLRVSEIAYNAGFNNPFYFSKQFARQYGASPRAYRVKLAMRGKAH
jgi:AraC family transcriptional regulator of arabinose operon